MERLCQDFPEATSKENLLKFVGAEIKGSKSNLQAKLLEEYWRRILSKQDTQVDKVAFLTLSTFEECTPHFENYDHVLLKVKFRQPEVIEELIKNVENQIISSCTLIFQSEIFQFEILSLLRQKYMSDDSLVVLPVYIHDDSKSVSKNVLENLQSGILFGRIPVGGAKIQRFYENLTQLSDLLESSLTSDASVLYATDNAHFARLHKTNSKYNITYIGSKENISHFQNVLNREDYMTDSENNNLIKVAMDQNEGAESLNHGTNESSNAKNSLNAVEDSAVSSAGLKVPLKSLKIPSNKAADTAHASEPNIKISSKKGPKAMQQEMEDMRLLKKYHTMLGITNHHL